MPKKTRTTEERITDQALSKTGTYLVASASADHRLLQHRSPGEYSNKNCNFPDHHNPYQYFHSSY